MEKNSADNSNNQSLTRKAYSIKEFCELFGVSRSFVYTLFNAGKLKSSKILGRNIISAEEVERFAREELAA